MPKKFPNAILIAAVRCKFYTVIDWTRCSNLDRGILERELTAVIKHVISVDAPELQPVERETLSAEILKEVRELDCNELIQLRSRLKPKVSVLNRVSNWIQSALQRSAERKYVREQSARSAKAESVG